MSTWNKQKALFFEIFGGEKTLRGSVAEKIRQFRKDENYTPAEFDQLLNLLLGDENGVDLPSCGVFEYNPSKITFETLVACSYAGLQSHHLFNKETIQKFFRSNENWERWQKLFPGERRGLIEIAVQVIGSEFFGQSPRKKNHPKKRLTTMR